MTDPGKEISMRTRNAVKRVRLASALLIVAGAGMASSPAEANLAQICNWGIGALAPTGPLHNYTQVMMTPVVMDFHTPPSQTSQVAFISFQGGTYSAGGVLRIMDGSCVEIARFPDSACPFTLPANCPSNLASAPHLVALSGLAAGRLDTLASPAVDIVGVLDNNRQLIDFNLVGGCLKPKWCSATLPAISAITMPSAPAIAELDRTTLAQKRHEIVVDDKVFDFNGAIRYAGNPLGPRTQAVVVANLLGSGNLPQVITGGGGYLSNPPAGNFLGLWSTPPSSWQNPQVTHSPIVFPAVAELDPLSVGPEIVVTDTMATTLRVLSASGAIQLASVKLPNPPWPAVGSVNPHCGGAPMIAKLSTNTVIGVATCKQYTLYRYKPGNGTANSGLLVQLWTQPIQDPSGQTTSTLAVRMIYYNDTAKLWVLNPYSGGAPMQSVMNTSATGFEAPVIASLSATSPIARVIVAASNYHLSSGGNRGVRIFSDTYLGPLRGYWNQHTYHVTNVTSSSGTIPAVEPASWLSPAHNTYRVQE